MIKNSLKYGGILCLVTVLCTLAVSSLYVVVDPIIIKRKIQKVQDNLGKIFVDAPYEYEDATKQFELDKNDVIDALYKITLPGDIINYVYELSPEGRNDEILFLIVYDTKGAVKKIQYVQMRETKGRGDKITTDKYLDAIYKQNANTMDVDMISGATYSSKAMKQSIEATSQHLINEVLK